MNLLKSKFCNKLDLPTITINIKYVLHNIIVVKGGFFSESAIRFSNLQISKEIFQKNYPELEI